jgi:hypothetical protein
MPQTSTATTLQSLFREARESIYVFLTEQGRKRFEETPYLRDDGHITCRRIVDDSSPNYLSVEARYYTAESGLPKYTFLMIPHESVSFVVSATAPEAEKPPSGRAGKKKAGNKARKAG